MLLAVRSAMAQEALQNMQAGETAAASRGQQMQSLQNQNYTFKNGDFSMLVVPSLGLEYDDNVNLAETGAQSDFIITPALDIQAGYQLTQRNLLFLDVTLGYAWYLDHSDYSTFLLNSSSRTGLSFDVGIKDVTVNLHDWISYSQGVGQNAATAGATPGGGFTANTQNGSIANTATYGTFQNTAGITGTWDLNKVTLSLGYDHQSVLSTTSQFDEQNYSAEMLFAKGGLQVRPGTTIGVETTAAFTSYDEDVLNDNDAYTIGPYIGFQPSAALTFTARGGYTLSEFQHTSAVIQTASQGSWYASLNMTHQPSDFFSYSLDIGREVQSGIVSDLLEDWYVRANIKWKIIKDWDLVPFLFYEHGDDGVGSVGNVPGNLNGSFDWYGGGFSVQHPLTSRISLAFNYEFTERTSGAPNESYTLNMVVLQLTYHPQ